MLHSQVCSQRVLRAKCAAILLFNHCRCFCCSVLPSVLSCLPAHLSACLFVCTFVRLSVYLSVSLPFCLCVCSLVHPSTPCVSVHLSVVGNLEQYLQQPCDQFFAVATVLLLQSTTSVAPTCCICTSLVTSLCCYYSFAATERYLILILAPCVLSPLKMLINKSLFKDVQWKPQNGVKFYVVDKQKKGPGHVATFRLDSQLACKADFCFFAHPLPHAII